MGLIANNDDNQVHSGRYDYIEVEVRMGSTTPDVDDWLPICFAEDYDILMRRFWFGCAVPLDA